MSIICKELHEIVNSMYRMKFPFESEAIPSNGIYILFENNESGHGVDRIVRIGTHTGNNQLKSRLYQHFVNKNKDRSIFRKNIGRAILNKNSDSYIDNWELDLTSKINKDKYHNIIDYEYQYMIENRVTEYIQDMFSFVVIEENDKVKRLWLEAKLISEVSNCRECKSSSDWIGRYSTKEKIRESGLWQVNELYKDGFDKSEFIAFKNSALHINERINK